MLRFYHHGASLEVVAQISSLDRSPRPAHCVVANQHYGSHYALLRSPSHYSLSLCVASHNPPSSPWSLPVDCTSNFAKTCIWVPLYMHTRDIRNYSEEDDFLITNCVFFFSSYE